MFVSNSFILICSQQLWYASMCPKNGYECASGRAQSSPLDSCTFLRCKYTVNCKVEKYHLCSQPETKFDWNLKMCELPNSNWLGISHLPMHICIYRANIFHQCICTRIEFDLLLTSLTHSSHSTKIILSDFRK